jgi:hypothetical protein
MRVVMKFAGMAVAVAASACLAGAASASAFVSGSNSGTTDLGLFSAGTYHVTGSGTVDLVGPVGSGFDLNADGVPTSTVTAPGYGYFNPNGSYTADGNYGPGGPTIKFGALMGSFIPVAPLGDFAAVQPNYFNLGVSSTIVLASAGHLYGQVNDSFYSNNGGGFEVSLSAVPEPGAWALMLVGIGGLGAALRARRGLAATA